MGINKNKKNGIQFYPSTQKKQLDNELVRIRRSNRRNGLIPLPANVSVMEGIDQFLNVTVKEYFSNWECTTLPTDKIIKEKTALLKIMNGVASIYADKACVKATFPHCHIHYDKVFTSMHEEAFRWTEHILFQKQLICFLYQSIELIEKDYLGKKEIDINHLLTINHKRMQGKDIEPFDKALKPYLIQITHLIEQAKFPQALLNQLRINLYHSSKHLENVDSSVGNFQKALAVPNLLTELLNNTYEVIDGILKTRVDGIIQEQKEGMDKKIFSFADKNIRLLKDLKNSSDALSPHFPVSNRMSTPLFWSSAEGNLSNQSFPTNRTIQGLEMNGGNVGEAFMIAGSLFLGFTGLVGLVFVGKKVYKNFFSSPTRYNCRQAEEEAKAEKKLLSRV